MQYYIIIKYLFQNYQNELNKIPNDFDKQIDNKIIELQKISQSKEKKNKKLNRQTVRNILVNEYKDSITNKYNCEWNKSLCINLNINQITTLTNDVYINFYDGNKIVLISSYLDNDKKHSLIF